MAHKRNSEESAIVVALDSAGICRYTGLSPLTFDKVMLNEDRVLLRKGGLNTWIQLVTLGWTSRTKMYKKYSMRWTKIIMDMLPTPNSFTHSNRIHGLQRNLVIASFETQFREFF